MFAVIQYLQFFPNELLTIILLAWTADDLHHVIS